MTGERTGKIDFHLHSYASNVTDYYAANTFAIPESYSDPVELYHELKRRGMSLVTLTDHNSIDGVKELLDRGFSDVFLSAEMTATFPEDGCNIHVTVANMTEAQFAEIDRLRSNLYDMLDYVERQIAAEASHPAGNRLAYFMTHPLMSTQNRPYGREGALTVAHIEKALLLFRCLEVRNGTRTRALNDFTERLLRSIDRETMERLANEHGIVPRGPEPWRKATVAGSDDHCGINHGLTWTEFPLPEGRAPVANDVVDAIRGRLTTAAGAHGGPVTLAHAMVKLLYDGSRLRDATAGQKGVRVSGPIQSLLRAVFDSGSLRLREKLAFQGRMWFERVRSLRSRQRRAPRDRSFERILAAEAQALLGDRAFRARLAAATRTDERIFAVVSELLNRLFQHYVARLRACRSLDLVRVVKEGVALVTSNLFVSLPYLLSYLHQSSDRMLVRDVRQRFRLGEAQRLALVTDTFFEINGVSRTIRRMIVEAERRGVDLTVVTCLGAAGRAAAAKDAEVRGWLERGRLIVIDSIVEVGVPEYAGLDVRVPPFLELLKVLQEQGFHKVQISTPGTVGVAGLLAAKLLQLETSSTYHTSFPEYVEDYTKDISLEALAWKYMILFYHSVDEVVVPSRAIAKLLHSRGLRNRKLLLLDRWVDTERFHPAKRDPLFWQRFGPVVGDQVRFLYVGRVGLEKNLDVLADAFERVAARHACAHLVIVGDGPYRRTLEQRLADLPVTFTGFLEGEALAVAYASADVKLFPSTTDTWGNAPLEAQAAGLPVVVSDKGGPQELMVHGVTGYCVRGRDVDALVDAMERLVDGETRRRLGRGARRFTVENRVEQPFLAIFDSESYRRDVKRRRREVEEREDIGGEAPVEAYLVDHRIHDSWAEGA